MKQRSRQSGFSAVELLITLFVAAAFLISGYQLYIFAVKDGGTSRTQAAASREVDNYISRYKNFATDACTSQSPLVDNITTPGNPINYPITTNVPGIGTATIRVDITCPFSPTDTATSQIKVTLTYGSPTKTMVSSTLYKPACPKDFALVPGDKAYGTNDFCVMRFEAKNVSSVPVSQAAGAPWTNISQTSAMTYAKSACTGCHLMTEAEWLTIAANVTKVIDNWSSSIIGHYWIHTGLVNNCLAGPSAVSNPSSPVSDVPVGSNDCGSPEYNLFNNDRSFRSLSLTNGESIWDFSGNAAEWTSGQSIGSQPGASGYAWRKWNSTDLSTHGTLFPNPWPISISEIQSDGWTAGYGGFNAGLGKVYSSSTETALKGFVRGSSVATTLTSSGIYYLDMSRAPSWTDANTGFRVTR